jgi:WD40 repeat protein/serine/threonine protein kinase
MAQWNPQVNELFLKAVEIASPREREAFLDQACAGDADLRAKVEALLRAGEQAGSFLEAPAVAVPAGLAATVDEPRSEGPGTVIGPYKLLQPLGEGGFGVVYLAEQREPVRRQVALKILKPGMDTKQVVARFEAERQALALMDHPSIAKVFDAGATPAGRPYFVMELVKGVPITEYCHVCHAVQHAHQKGIIHRDIKPSNVLVTQLEGRPVPKVIDFGIAKATGPQLTDQTLFTNTDQAIGTPLYMSPEQAGQSGLDVDTRSDIYSLGVLLYELLTGTTPFDREKLKKAAFDEIRRIIREEEPPRPSNRLSEMSGPQAKSKQSKTSLASIAAQRKTEPAKLTKLVRGDLDWIVMKSLEKDRNRRYETANGFAADVLRYLTDEPVLACPPSLGYRLSKFTRRNKGPVIAASVILLVLIGGIIGTTYGLLEAQESEGHAVQEAIQAGKDRDLANRARAEEKKQRTLAEEQRKLAVSAAEKEKKQRKLAEDRGNELRQSLYFAEMNLAGQAANQRTGLARVAKLLSPHRGSPHCGWEWFYLHALGNQEQLTISLPTGTDVVWSPDGTRLASVAKNAGVTVWDALSGKPSLILEDPNVSSIAVAWSPDGSRLASLSHQGKITLWDAATGKQRLTFQAYDSLVTGGRLAWAPDGARLASIGGGLVPVKVWDVQTGKEVFKLTGANNIPNSLAWGRDGSRVACADWTGRAILWDGATGKVLFNKVVVSLQPGSSSWSALSPDCSLVFVENSRHTLEIWRATAGHELEQSVKSGVGFNTSSLSWDHEGNRLARGSSDGLIDIIDAANGKTLVSLSGHSASVYSVAWSPKGTRLASVSADETLRIWDANARGNPIVLQVDTPSSMHHVAWSPSGKRLASADQHGVVRIWDVASRKEALSVTHSSLRALAWNNDGARLATAGGFGILKIWDGSTGGVVFTDKIANLQGTSLAWSPDGTRLALGGTGSSVQIYDAVTWKKTHLLNPDNQHVGPVSWSPDGTRLASACKSGKLPIWNTNTGDVAMHLPGHEGATLVAWCPSGRRLVTAGGDRAIKMWDATTGEELMALGHTGSIASVSWSPDGSRLASGSSGNVVTIWDSATGKQVTSFTGMGEHLLAWSPDGLSLAIGSTNGMTKILDATRGYELAGVVPPAPVRAMPKFPVEPTPKPPAGPKPPLPLAKADAMEAVYKAIKLTAPKIGAGPFKVGDTIRIDYALKNTLDGDLQLPQAVLGGRQHWIERLGDDATIPDRQFRQGNRYPSGGNLVKASAVVSAGQSFAFTWTIGTKRLPPGRYRYYVEYTSVNHKPLQSASVEFELAP